MYLYISFRTGWVVFLGGEGFLIAVNLSVKFQKFLGFIIFTIIGAPKIFYFNLRHYVGKKLQGRIDLRKHLHRVGLFKKKELQ